MGTERFFESVMNAADKTIDTQSLQSLLRCSILETRVFQTQAPCLRWGRLGANASAPQRFEKHESPKSNTSKEFEPYPDPERQKTARIEHFQQNTAPFRFHKDQTNKRF
jgi:hypothetical protein